MIIEPDFLDHWKTQMLIGLTHDKSSPLLVIRLWAHCHQRKAWIFPEMSNEALKAVCRWEGEADRLRGLLTECGFLDKESECIRVHEWEVVNYVMVRNWTNGKSGGRPPKPSHNPTETQNQNGLSQLKPKPNPTETQTPKKADVGKPLEYVEGNGIRREEGNGKGKRGKRACTPPTIDEARAYALELGLPEEEADKFFDHHQARGWTLKGGIPVRDWRATLRTWCRFFEKGGGVLRRAATTPTIPLREVSERWLFVRVSHQEKPCLEMAGQLVAEHTPEQVADIRVLGAAKYAAWWSEFEPFLTQVLAWKTNSEGVQT